MIVFDMEWNSGMYDNIRLDEILQIGAVKVAGPGEPILDTFNIYIRPQVHRRYSPAAAELPDLPLSLESQWDLPAAMERFLDWCGGDDLFATWGGNDLTVLIRNDQYWRLKHTFPDRYIDLQRAFCHQVGAANTPSLERALEYCGVPDIFDPHNALCDAVYTWMVCRPLPRSAWEAAWCEANPEPKPPKLPKRPTPWKGGFDTLDELLGSRGLRRAVCPKCEYVSRVYRWYPASPTLYYAPFTCACGRSYYLRLEVRQRKDQYWGNAAPVRQTGKHKEFFEGYLSAKEPIVCRSFNAARPPRRRRRRKPRTQSPPSET